MQIPFNYYNLCMTQFTKFLLLIHHLHRLILLRLLHVILKFLLYVLFIERNLKTYFYLISEPPKVILVLSFSRPPSIGGGSGWTPTTGYSSTKWRRCFANFTPAATYFEKKGPIQNQRPPPLAPHPSQASVLCSFSHKNRRRSQSSCVSPQSSCASEVEPEKERRKAFRHLYLYYYLSSQIRVPLTMSGHDTVPAPCVDLVLLLLF